MNCYSSNHKHHDSAGIASTDIREALYNDRAIGLAGQIQLPREAVTSLHGLVVDLDANLLKQNPWFSPGDTAEAFNANIQPVLQRHPIMRHAEIRHTGRWLHAILWFAEPIQIHTASDQEHWAALHRVLMSSVPSDPAAPVLIALTRLVGSINSKSGGQVRTLKQGEPIQASVLEDWVKMVALKPFEAIGNVLFGDQRISPCPYCRQPDSHLDLGADVGHCYGPCQRITMTQLFQPFLKPTGSDQNQVPEAVKDSAKPRKGKARGEETTNGPGVISINVDVILRIDPTRVKTVTIEVRQDQDSI